VHTHSHSHTGAGSVAGPKTSCRRVTTKLDKSQWKRHCWAIGARENRTPVHDYVERIWLHFHGSCEFSLGPSPTFFEPVYWSVKEKCSRVWRKDITGF